VHPSAEHIFLFLFRATFLRVCSSSSADFRFLVDAFVFFTAFADNLLLLAAELARVELARRRVKETSAGEFLDFFFFLASFAAAAASAFLSWLSL
jgi:hypothetical protein